MPPSLEETEETHGQEVLADSAVLADGRKRALSTRAGVELEL